MGRGWDQWNLFLHTLRIMLKAHNRRTCVRDIFPDYYLISVSYIYSMSCVEKGSTGSTFYRYVYLRRTPRRRVPLVRFYLCLAQHTATIPCRSPEEYFPSLRQPARIIIPLTRIASALVCLLCSSPSVPRITRVQISERPLSSDITWASQGSSAVRDITTSKAVFSSSALSHQRASGCL